MPTPKEFLCCLEDYSNIKPSQIFINNIYEYTYLRSEEKWKNYQWDALHIFYNFLKVF